MPNSSSHIAVAGNESNVELLLCEAPEKAMDNTQILSSAVAAPRTLSIVDEWDEISGNHENWLTPILTSRVILM